MIPSISLPVHKTLSHFPTSPPLKKLAFLYVNNCQFTCVIQDFFVPLQYER